MTLYRVFKTLAIKNDKIPPGQVIPLKLSLDKIEVLERVGAIGAVSTPPLTALPDWREFAEKLPPGMTVEQFIEGDATFLSGALGITLQAVKDYQADLLAFLCVPPPGQK